MARFATFNGGRRRAIALVVTLFTLAGCGGGNQKSVLGSDQADAFAFNTAIAYIKRPLPDPADIIDVLDEPLQFNPGAHLYIRESAALNANEINISRAVWENAFGPGAQYDVRDLNVSPDGEKLVFAMHAPEADPDDPQFTWNLWEYIIATQTLQPIIGDEALLIGQVLAAEEGHDVQPAVQADGDIVFASTRQDTNRSILVDEGKVEYSGQQEDAARNANEPTHALVLHTIDPSTPGSNAGSIKQISFNQSHDFAPLVMPDGQLLYQRWDNIGNNDVVSLYRIHPEGGQLELHYGYHSVETLAGSGSNHLASMRYAPNGNIYAIATTNPTSRDLLGGEIIELDTDNYIDLSTPTFANTGLGGTASTAISNNGVEVLNPISEYGRFASVWPVNDGSDRLLVSWSDCWVVDPNDSLLKTCLAAQGETAADLAAPRFGIWMMDPADGGTQRPVVNAETGFMYSEVVATEVRQISTPLIDPVDTNLAAQQAILDIRSIYDRDGSDSTPAGIATLADPALTDPDTIEPKFLRLVKAVSIPDEDLLDFDNAIFGVSANQLMREIVGYVPIEPDGSVRAIVPANLPLMIDIVDRDGKRINIENPNQSLRHENWLHLAEGATLSCRGCHANNSTEPHGRLSAQPPSAHPGATATLPYPNTEPALFAPNGGETMAEIFTHHNGIAARTPSIDLVYDDDWTDDSGALTKAASFSISYDNLNTTAPTSTGTNSCTESWDVSCRITINYPEHIQPIWELTRTPVDDGTGTLVDSCIGCHAPNANTVVPAGQLDLTNTASADEALHFTSYRELLVADAEQADNGGTPADRLWECNQIDPNNPAQPLFDTDGITPLRENRTPTGVTPSATVAGAVASGRFFDCLTQDNACPPHTGDTLPAAFPDECIEIGGNQVVDAFVINHNGMLTPEELRLIAEWLDIGAQYYNNPFDAPPP